MLIVLLISSGIAIRQVDRLWFSDLRLPSWRFTRAARPATVHGIFALQRARRNNITPVLLLLGHWVEIAGHAMLPRLFGIPGTALLVLVLAVKCRHLQEVSHFGVHTSLCRSRRLGDALTEFAAQGPLVLATVDGRRESHVRIHHPNAAIPGVDPNMDDLLRAGIGPGVTRRRFVAGLLFPLTPVGVVATGRSVWRNTMDVRVVRWRPAIVFLLLAAAYALGGPGALVGVLIARLVLYPFLAWMSLLVEHQWFREVIKGRPAEVEAQRCVRIYSRRKIWQLVARGVWLPYGDLYHFGHSVYPTIRWNYLPSLERAIGLPSFTPDGMLARNGSSVAARLWVATRQADSLSTPDARLVAVEPA
jgi:fatty acid desaturase